MRGREARTRRRRSPAFRNNKRPIRKQTMTYRAPVADISFALNNSAGFARALADGLYGDLSANSGNNALSRDPEFTPAFLKRHQDKLIFGSDCSCTDGKGGGVSQNNNPEASRLAGTRARSSSELRRQLE